MNETGKRVVTRLLVLAACMAVANADLYPFVPFGLFGCCGLLAGVAWLHQDKFPDSPEPSRRAVIMSMVTTAVCTASAMAFAKIGLNLDIGSIEIAVANRPVMNGCLAIFAAATLLNPPKKEANTEVEHTRT